MKLIRSIKNMIAKLIVLYLIRGPKVYYVTGMRRSGNHAFINWLENALETQSIEFKEDTESNFLNFTNSGRTVHIDEINWLSGKKYAKILWANRNLIRNCDFLILSSEDCKPGYIQNFRIPRHDEAIYIKRSILNLVASRVKNLQKKAAKGIGWPRQNVDKTFFETLLSWHPLPEKFKIWEYDKWIDSKEYRLDFLESLGLEVDILPSISSQGGGSSFTGKKKRPGPQEALSRYKQVDFSKPIIDLLTDDRYRKLLQQAELDYLKSNM